MDKETLSAYGWLIVVIIIGLLIIGAATPFGRGIFAGITNTSKKVYQTNSQNLNINNDAEDYSDDDDWGAPAKLE